MKEPSTLLWKSTLLVVGYTFLLVAVNAYALVMDGGLLEQGGSCDSSYSWTRTVLLAGSSFTVSVSNQHDRPREPLKPGWPQGYSLEAALDLPLPLGYPSTPMTNFVPQPGLMERLRPVPYHSFWNQLDNNALSQNDSVNLMLLNDKHFALHIPPDLAGHALIYRACYSRDGNKFCSSPYTIYVIAPCDQADSARILASKMYEASARLDYAQVVSLADSMLTLGWTNRSALGLAQSAAMRLGQFDKAVAYLDRMYADFGLTWYKFSWGPKPKEPRSFEARQRYEDDRARLLEEKAQSEAQKK
jgi:hypothetical protein